MLIQNTDVLSNAIRTVVYYVDALKDDDFDSAKLEFEELKVVMKQLEELQKKLENRKKLFDLVYDMKKKGMDIDFAKRSLLLGAKNAVENNQNMENNIKKVQGA